MIASGAAAQLRAPSQGRRDWPVILAASTRRIRGVARVICVSQDLVGPPAILLSKTQNDFGCPCFIEPRVDTSLR